MDNIDFQGSTKRLLFFKLDSMSHLGYKFWTTMAYKNKIDKDNHNRQYYAKHAEELRRKRRERYHRSKDGFKKG